ncbi:MAG: V-type ATP synthase subunit E family protein [Clostridiales bacterium]
MNGIDKLTGRIMEEADAEVAGIINKAHQQAESIIKTQKVAAEELYHYKIKKGKEASEQKTERLVSVTKLEAKKLILQTKQDMVSLAFDKALTALLNLPEEKYTDLLASLAVDAVKTGQEEIVLSVKDLQLYGEKVAAKANGLLEQKGIKGQLKCADKTAKIQGGLLVKDLDIEVNCSFETLIRLMHDELATQVSSVLFK